METYLISVALFSTHIDSYLSYLLLTLGVLCTLEIPYNEKLEHQRPLCIERERDPLHIRLFATRCYAYYMMRAVSLSVMPCD